MIIVISSRSGGVGKSTASQHLAAYLAQRRGAGRVALVDADANETCIDWVARGPGQKFDVLGPEEDTEGYDHIIVDTAAAPDSSELADVLETTDLLLIPTTPSMADISPAIATASEFDLSEGSIQLLLTLCPPRPSRMAETTMEALKEADIPVLPQTITRRNCYLDAIATGQHVGQMKGASAVKAWAEWKTLGQSIWKGWAS